MKNTVWQQRFLVIVSITTWIGFTLLKDHDISQFFHVENAAVGLPCLGIFLLVTWYLYKKTGISSLIFTGKEALDERQRYIQIRALGASYIILAIIITINNMSILKDLNFIYSLTRSYFLVTVLLIPSWVLMWIGHQENIVDENN